MNFSLFKSLKWHIYFGLCVVFFFLGGAAYWAFHAPLSGAIIASGVVGYEGKLRSIQNLEGGLIKDIRVREGDKVRAGQVLLEIDPTKAFAREAELRNRIRALAAEEARLIAERSGLSEVAFHHPYLNNLSDSKVQSATDQQLSIFLSRRELLSSKKLILSTRIEQLNRQTEGLSKKISGLQKQLRLTKMEAKTQEALVEKGIGHRRNLFLVQREEAELTAEVGAALAEIARVEEAVSEIELQIVNQKNEWIESVNSRLAEVQALLRSQSEMHQETIFSLSHTRVRAPIDGTILNLSVDTVGGVIHPGTTLMDIAPETEELVIRAKILPHDIEQVKLGSSAEVMISAYSQRHMQRIPATIYYLSPDIIEEESGESYFQVYLRIDESSLAAKNEEHDVFVSAGMPAEVFVTTESTTVAEYLVEPILISLRRAFRES
ncbi:HlyD family type I secretion periplasmic adaptor subunit [Ruegeria sp. SCP11]|uniref:HlyD family type I secretion periplasmic adaptor subunit n=1 Tax=Ruegeria sp. SCP11 TaxID=3141378 RepID=UPI00333DBEDA